MARFYFILFFFLFGYLTVVRVGEGLLNNMHIYELLTPQPEEMGRLVLALSWCCQLIVGLGYDRAFGAWNTKLMLVHALGGGFFLAGPCFRV